MLAGNLIADIIPPVKTSDTVQKVADRMTEFKLNHLPIVNESQFLGLVCDDDLIEIADYTTEVGNLNLSLSNPFVHQHQHIYDVVRLFHDQHLSIVPVLDANNNYLGLISYAAITEYLATLTSVAEQGGIIVLEINNRDNSLAQIAQIVESENAQILSSYVNAYPDSTKMEITIKVNKTDITSIIASFLRHDYVVSATFNHLDDQAGSADRYDSLMNYLSI